MRFIVVFDTNVLFSAIGWGGKPLACLDLARSGAIEGATCAEILDELRQILLNKTSLSVQQAEEILHYLRAFLRVVRIPDTFTDAVVDTGDQKVLECAFAARATHLITGDHKHLLPLQSYKGTMIVSPSEFLQIFLTSQRR